MIYGKHYQIKKHLGSAKNLLSCSKTQILILDGFSINRQWCMESMIIVSTLYHGTYKIFQSILDL